MLSSLQTAASLLLDVAFPPTCPACGQGASDGFCRGCSEDLDVFSGPACRRCATPLLATAPAADDCPACRAERWAFDEAVALGAYDGLLRRLVLDAKRPAGEGAVVELGRMTAREHRGRILAYADAVVVPTPQHWRRRLLRRADGVAAFAGALAGELGLPCRSVLRRTRPTRRQTEVAPSDRRANVRGAFRVTRNARLAGRTVLLTDDVLTTGSTCHAAAQALKRAGAARVVAVVAARRLGRL